MKYFLKKTKNNKGLYLQIYESHYVPEKKESRNFCYKSIGYFEDLIKNGVSDPIKHVKKIVDELNSFQEGTVAQIQEHSAQKNVGYFLLKSMFDYLGIDKHLKLMTSNKKVQYDFCDFVKMVTYAQVVSPGSKHKAFEKTLPNLFNAQSYSYDQILDGINYIGQDYQKYIELINHHIDLRYPRNTNTVFFDCTNYYFEIDLARDDKQKGPSKENRKSPIIGQALLLDANQIPIGMKMYPGNESEKPLIRELIADMKERFDIEGRTVQVADKGLNCARNIYATVKECNDGYIFSKSTHGTGLSQIEKNWILLDDDKTNTWTEVFDSNNKVIYKHKSCIDVFKYSFVDDIEPFERIEFTVKEKRVVTFNPSLARKKRLEIEKEVEKAKSMTTYKDYVKDDYGDCAKYVIFETKDKDGKKIKAQSKINQAKVDEDLALAGYNLLVTSEINATPQEIYNIYHGLWKIENSFRVLKTYLEARPVFLQLQDSIYGHFLICYYSLTILRLLEKYVFKNELSTEQLVEFIRNYTVSECRDNSYVNNAVKSSEYEIVKNAYGIRKLGNLYLSKRDIENILNIEVPD